MSGVFLHDSADKTPPPAPGRHPLTPISGADWHPRGGVRLPPQAWLILTLVVVGQYDADIPQQHWAAQSSGGRPVIASGTTPAAALIALWAAVQGEEGRG